MDTKHVSTVISLNTIHAICLSVCALVNTSVVYVTEFAYITYRNFRLAERALSKLDGTPFLGSVLYAEPARINQANNAKKMEENNFQLDSSLISKLDERAEAMCSLHVKNIAPNTTQKAFL